MVAPSRPRVVAVDDHAAMLKAATTTLSAAFDVVGTAGTGAAGVEVSLRLQPDVVVLDISMPDLDGFQAAAELRKAGSHARIVFLSNFSGDDYVLAAVSQGASAFVAKTRMVDDLIDAVNHAVAGRVVVPSARVLPRWRPRSGRAHDLQIYRTDQALVDDVVGFFDTAFEAGDSMLSVASAPHRLAIDAGLRAHGHDVDALVATGRYSSMDSHIALEGVFRDGVPHRDQFVAIMDAIMERALKAATGPSPQVTMYGEIAPILCADGRFDAMLQLERIADEYTASRPLAALCGYSTACLHDGAHDVMAMICGEHAAIVPAERGA